MNKDWNIKKLQEENTILRKKLLSASTWMKKSIEEEKKFIQKQKLKWEREEERESFLYANIENIILKKIENFFPVRELNFLSEEFVDNILSSEINFYNLQKNPHLDGILVIIGYHKILDMLIEDKITSPFRKFAKKENQTTLEVNDVLEKSIHLIVNNGYILSVWRLFGILKKIKETKKLSPYLLSFKNFLNEYGYIEQTVFHSSFYYKLEILVESEVLGSKRHKGHIEKKETIKIRELLIGNFEDKDCIIYELLSL